MAELDRKPHALATDELDQVSGGAVCITYPTSPIESASSVAGSGGSGAGKIDAGTLSITNVMDKASPLF